MPVRVLSGLDTIQFGDVEEPIAMPAVMTEAFKTYRDTVTISEADPETTEHFSDQADDPFLVTTTKGAKEIKGSTYDWSPETLQSLKGGTIVDGVWTEPASTPVIEKAVRLNPKSGDPLNFPKCSISAKLNYEMKRNSVALLEFTIKPLVPMSV